MQTITDVDFLNFVGKQESQYIIPASRLADDVVLELHGNEQTRGDLLPWSKTHNVLALRPGEVSIWGGFNGHGKSQILGHVCAWGLKTSSWLIASMEMPPRKTMARMMRQVAGNNAPAESFIHEFHQWTDGRLWIYDQTDTVEYQKILGMVHYAAQELKIKHIAIDSLLKCGFKGGRDQLYSQQIDFIDRITWAAKTYNCHIHIVHHMRKGEGGEYSRPGKHDFRGAGEIVDMVDNAFVIHRNKRKEDAEQRGEMVDSTKPDTTLECVKNRHGDWEGLIKLWFHPGSQQYTPTQERRPIPYE